MTLDQEIQVWVAIGTWLAAIATFSAVVVALYLAKQGERIKLKCHVGLREQIYGDGTPAIKCLCFDVTNLSERPVTINSVGWVIGRRKSKRYAMQPTPGPDPRELAYSKQTMCIIRFDEAPDWLSEFASGFIRSNDWAEVKTLRAQIHTSVGLAIEVVPEQGFLKALIEHVRSA